MKQTRKSWAGLYSTMAATTLGVLAPTAAQAGTAFSLTPADGTNSSWATITNRVITILIFIAGAAAVLYLLWSGVQYVTAGGDDEKATTARKGLINAIIGIVLVSAAYLIFEATKSTLNKTSTNPGSSTEL